MKVKASTYVQNKDGRLQMLDEGECLIYSPDCSALNKTDPYVALNFGKYHVHLNKKDFKKFCKKFLYDNGRKEDGLPLLRQG